MKTTTKTEWMVEGKSDCGSWAEFCRCTRSDEALNQHRQNWPKLKWRKVKLTTMTTVRRKVIK